MPTTRRLQANGETSTIHTGKDTNIMQKLISRADLTLKMLSGNKKRYFFQNSAVHAGVMCKQR